ncbi:MAG: Fis family transcriptional regulator [Ignavibacteria bacterium GWA2_55_11]|nr:MAG: Fis family transcriptional regulator [Ignavibacteria bacterium GWA2_55_11]OGU43628.1 MAG: Fis family transcriptional regulator [Ignavibacteria bacterium GWC2_56_12]OGU66236.1 MAG: Fis family transcriptional regulator [Ignavibacteria bacterium RIFCSPHIGHO2_02_FULL_56_12]OGU69908.1 MAG: Fis family transcriptional regulator [Ignavibacteria bacterium RIFCSPLOWO2_02_FULL_55_14]OGU76396.1 MAG: Fis family transcriptional regulator [Ignavibacteria bacterium RIFCSPLOWO2_12_FULL_56_21]
MAPRILIVDDEQIIRESVVFVLQNEGFQVAEAANGRLALEMHRRQPFDIVITDIEMPEMRGTELLRQVRQETPETFVVIVTAFASVETAVTALREGASDYVLKPINFDDLLHRVKKLLEVRSLSLENAILRQELQRKFDFDAIIGQSSAMKKVFGVIERVARSDGTVLITGKSGTGKELIARAIHFHSLRAAKRFVPVNCGAIVDTLFESELFGHKKGSFTGSTGDKEGLFKVAHEGTIFLDEVSEIPLNLQVKLLRALEQKEITPIGTTDVIKVDVRIIAATNKDLRKEVEMGKFRDDLFYRLNVVEVDLPQLSARPDDIPKLANHFLDAFSKQMGKRIKGFTNDAMRALLRYQWKGEVRELENAVERAAIFCDGDFIGIEHLPDSMAGTHDGGGPAAPVIYGDQPLKEAVKDFEKMFIQQALTRHQHNKEETAKALGMSLSSLYRKIEELEIGAGE